MANTYPVYSLGEVQKSVSVLCQDIWYNPKPKPDQANAKLTFVRLLNTPVAWDEVSGKPTKYDKTSKVFTRWMNLPEGMNPSDIEYIETIKVDYVNR